MYVYLITHSTLYAICQTNYPRLSPRGVHGTISSLEQQQIQLGDRPWVRIMPRSKHFLLPRVILKFLLLGVTLIGAYGLNLPEVGKLLVPSIPVKLSHMHISGEIWYNFQLDMYHFPFPAFCSYEKRQRWITRTVVILEKQWLQKSVVPFTKSVGNENSDGRHHEIWVCIFYDKVALPAEF